MSFRNQQKKINSSSIVKQTEESIAKTYLLNLFCETKVNQPRERLYGTDIGFCPRKNIYLSQYNPDQTITALSKFRTDFGLSAENSWINALINHNKLFTSSLKITDVIDHHDKDALFFSNENQLNYSGVIDFIYYDEHDQLVLVDSKNTSSLPDKPSLQFIRQVQFYSAVTGFDNAILLFTTRQCGFLSDLECSIFEIDTSYDELFKVMTNAYVSRLAIDAKLLYPIQDGFKKTTTCKYCNFNSFCWGENKETIVYPLEEMLIEKEMMIFHEAKQLAKKFLEKREERNQILLNYIKGLNENK